MKSMFECPYCDGLAILKNEKHISTFRKEDFNIFTYFYRCEKCKQEFTTTELDEVNINQVYNRYRERYSIPNPEQLNAVRQYYGLSAARMSEILGFGPNQYRLYENGNIPEGGNATILRLILDPNNFKAILLNKPNVLPKNKFEEIIDKIEGRTRINLTQHFKYYLFPKYEIPNKYTGYSVPNFEKFANMVLFFLKNAPFKVRLNKLLFFADFAQYKYTAHSISGCKYLAIDMGSVPDNYSYIFGLLENEDYLTTKSVSVKGNETDKFVPLKLFDEKIFTPSEIEILNSVLKKFRYKTTEEIKYISHKEQAWIDNVKRRALIDFSLYAPQLIAL